MLSTQENILTKFHPGTLNSHRAEVDHVHLASEVMEDKYIKVHSMFIMMINFCAICGHSLQGRGHGLRGRGHGLRGRGHGLRGH